MWSSLLLLAVLFPAWAAHPQARPAPSPPPITVKPFPKPDFTLREAGTRRRGNKPRNAGELADARYGLDNMAFSGDGKTLALGRNSSRVDLWDVAKKEQLRSIDTHQGATVVAISPNGELLATGGDDPEHTILIWEVASGKRLKQFKGPPDDVVDLRFDPSGTRLDVGTNGADNAVFDVFTGAPVAKLAGAQFGRFSLDGSMLVTVGARRVVVWNTTDWSQVSSVPAGPDYPTTLAAFPEEGLVVIGGPKVTRVLRLSSGKTVAQFGTGLAGFTAFNDDGTLIFAGIDGAIGIWDTAGKQYCASPKSSNSVVALSPDSQWLAAGAADGTAVEIWDVQRLLAACGVPQPAPNH